MSSPPLTCIVEDAKALRTSVADLMRADDDATALSDDRWRKRAAEAGAVFLRRPLDAKPRFGLRHRNQTAAGAVN